MNGVPIPPGERLGERFTPADHAPSHILTLRVELKNKPGAFARLAAEIAERQGNLGAVEIISADGRRIVRDLEVFASDEKHGQQIVDGIRALPDIHLINVSDQIFHMHLGGKIEVRSKYPLTDRTLLSQVYTPGVARVVKAIHADPKKVQSLTIKRNSVAIVTDGTAVLGLGDYGPYAAIPVMEGKAMLFREFAGIDAFPICLDTKDIEAIIQTCRYIAPVFGGINLEDIAAPRCFEIERRLRAELDIPVFHDDQHGASIVVMAALRNALRVVRKDISAVKVVISGAGAAGCSVARMLSKMGVKRLVVCDRQGAIHRGRTGDELGDAKGWIAENTNAESWDGPLGKALEGADVFIGLSTGNLVSEAELSTMAENAIVFPLALPEPEVAPEIAWKIGRVVATGRSDYPNQVNNALVFPGVFRGALDTHATCINDAMEMAAAEALADVVRPNELSPEYIIPSIFNPATAKQVATAVARAALKSGAARHQRPMAT